MRNLDHVPFTAPDGGEGVGCSRGGADAPPALPLGSLKCTVFSGRVHLDLWAVLTLREADLLSSHFCNMQLMEWVLVSCFDIIEEQGSK